MIGSDIDWYKYLGVSHTFLYIEALIVWIAGVLACAEISSRLFTEIYQEDPSSKNLYLILGVLFGLLFGLFQTYILFFRVCRRNLDRILSLEKPLIFNCFRIQFYLFFGTFDTICVIVSEKYAKDTISKTIMASLDMSVSLALCLSIYIFYQYWGNIRARKAGEPYIDNSEPLIDSKA